MANTDQAKARKPHKPVAIHALLDASGNVVETEEAATGIRYTLLGPDGKTPHGKPFDYQHGQHKSQDCWLACFGAKTLATNMSSQVRNNPKGSGSLDDMLAAIVERFGGMHDDAPGGPKWMDRTREGGPAVNVVELVNAIVDVLVASGKFGEEARQEATDERLDKYAADENWAALMRRAARGDRADIAAAYAKRMGRQAISDADL